MHRGLGGPNSPFAYRFLPQVLQYVACMRDSFSAIIRGEDRGAKMLQTHASRITDLHATLVELVDKEKKERDYHRCEKQARLDRMLHRRSMRRATESPYIIGDCMFDSVSYKLRLIGMPMSSIGIRRAAMMQECWERSRTMVSYALPRRTRITRTSSLRSPVPTPWDSAC